MAELVAVGVVAVGLALAARRGVGIGTWAPLGRLIGSERRALIGVVLFAFGLAALSSAARPPLPKIHDELSYLLAADTFAHGRLTNPPHPFWEHFETFHVLSQPSRQSKYPPGQALFMAAGQVLTGRPIVGVWLVLALSCGALYWCLRFWTPRRWAIFGALRASFPYEGANHWALRRRQVEERLLDGGAEHLVFVRYAPDHNVHNEWVHNLSQIDRQPIVWARAMSPEKDRALAEYFGERRAWVIEPDVSPPRLSRYVPGGSLARED